MSKSIAMRLLGLGAIFFAMLRTECSDKQNPTPSARIVPGPAIAAQLGVTLETTPPSATALTDGEEIEEMLASGSVNGRLDEPGETDRFLFQADEETAYLIEAVLDSLPSIRVDICDVYITGGFPTFGKVKEERGEPFRLVWTAPESSKYYLDMSSGDELGRGTGS